MKKITAKGWLKICSFFFLLSLPVFLGGCGSSSSSVPVFNVAGTWTIYNATNGEAGEHGPSTFTFATSDTTLTVTSPTGVVTTGTTTGNSVNFSSVGSDTFSYNYTGTVGSDGQTIQGTWSNNNPAGAQTGTWIGYDTGLGANSINNGSWSFTDGSGAIGTAAVSFNQSNTVITITTTVPTTVQQSPSGAISKSDVAFFVAGSDGDTYTYTGIINSATNMSGTWTNTNGQSGTWSATKT